MARLVAVLCSSNTIGPPSCFRSPSSLRMEETWSGLMVAWANSLDLLPHPAHQVYSPLLSFLPSFFSHALILLLPS